MTTNLYNLDSSTHEGTLHAHYLQSGLHPGSGDHKAETLDSYDYKRNKEKMEYINTIIAKAGTKAEAARTTKS